MTDQVLVIDDEQDAVEDIIAALEMRDIICRGETDPREAIESFRADPTDIVIADYLFPPSAGLTGVDLISQLQSIKPFTHFILISGKVDMDLDQESFSQDLRLKLKATGFLAKPIDLHKLVMMVQESLESIESASKDWELIAASYVEKGTVASTDVRALNEDIKAHLIKAVDDTTEES
jgi:DNA-binding NtrC family response regulator